MIPLSPPQFTAPWLHAVARVFDEAQTPIYLVGGAVRNALIGLPASDADVCGPARPERVMALCEGTPVRAFARAAHFGTVELHLTDADGARHMAEYTTFREDSYRCGHKPSAIRFADTLEVDALRRDFSVNAMYRALHADGLGALHDPTGGLACLRSGVLHTVTDDPDQVLKDDGLRILRAARFQAELDLLPTDPLLRSARAHAPLLREIARERLHDELAKILLSDLRYPSLARRAHPVRAGLETVRIVGAWEALFSPLACHEAALHAQSAYVAPPGLSPVAGRMALLFAGETPERLARVMRGLHFANRESDEAAMLLRVQRAAEDGSLSMPEATQTSDAALSHAITAYEALASAAEPRASAALTLLRDRVAALRTRRPPRRLGELAVNGNDLLPLCRELNAPTRSIGPILNRLWALVAEGHLANEREALLTSARRMLPNDKA